MAEFKEALDYGLSIEDEVVQILRRKYPSASKINAFKGYDIWIPEIKKSIEVKADKKSMFTGNIVIEIEMFNKPSGLMSTTADYWVFYDGEVYMLIKPMKIIECIFMNKLTYREFVGNGDTSSKKAFLVPKDKLFEYASNLEKAMV